MRREIPWVVSGFVASAIGLALVRTSPKTLDAVLALGDANGGNAISGLTAGVANQVFAHAEVLFLAVACLAFARAMVGISLAFPGPSGRVLRRVLARAEIPIAALTVLMFVVGFDASSPDRDGKTYMALADDAFISLRYANNFAHGHGLVFNPGERVEGYTNFLWVVLASLPLALGVALRVVPMLVFVANYAFVGLTAFAILATVRAFRGPTWAGALAAMAYVLDCNTLTYARTGLETPLLALVVAASVWAAARRRPLLPFLFLGLVPLVRSDGGLLDVVLAASFVLAFRIERRSVRWAWLALGIPALHVLFRRAYYGEWLPNTYYLKMLAVSDRLPLGLGGYGFRIPWFYGVWLVLAAGSLALPRQRWLGVGAFSACVLQAAYSVWVGGDAFWLLRFVAPTLPLLYVGGARFLGALRLPASRRLEAPLLLGLGICCIPFQAFQWRLGWLGNQGPWAMLNVDTAAWMRANVKPGQTSTVYPAGYVPYLAPDVRFVDVLGKADRTIAHQPSYESLAIGHNRFDFDYVYDTRKPDLTFVDRGCGDFEAPLAMTEAERAATRSHEVIHSPAWDYDRTHPTFLRLYARNAVHYVGSEPKLLGCIFVREGADVPQFWGRDGEVPRATTLRYAFDGARSDDRIALAGHWQRPSKEPVTSAMLDAWVGLDADLDVDACSTTGTDLPLVANGTPVPTTRGAERAGCTMLRWTIPNAVLESRPAALRMVFPADAPLLWVEAAAR